MGYQSSALHIYVCCLYVNTPKYYVVVINVTNVDKFVENSNSNTEHMSTLHA